MLSAWLAGHIWRGRGPKVATCQATFRTSCYCNLFLKEIREMNLQLLRKLLLVGVVWAYSITKAYSSVCSPSNTDIDIDAKVPGVISTPEFTDGSGS